MGALLLGLLIVRVVLLGVYIRALICGSVHMEPEHATSKWIGVYRSPPFKFQVNLAECDLTMTVVALEALGAINLM